MKQRRPNSLAPALLLALLLAGCATTPARRIQKNQEYFDSLPVADQARIRGGDIAIDYTPEMVRLALGDPHRRILRRTAAGESLIWLYTETYRHYERQRADIDGMTLTGLSGSRTVSGNAWINVLQERELVRTRVEFQNGKVFAIEEIPADPR